MRIKSNKGLLTIMFLIASILIFFFLTYKIIIMLEEYKEKEETMSHILYIEKIDNIINKIETERIYSAIYLGKKELTTRNQVNSFRKIVDQEIEELTLFISKDLHFTSRLEILSQISLELKNIRETINLRNIDYQVNLFQNYGNRVIHPLNKIIKEINKEFSKDYRAEIDSFNKLIETKKNLNRETSFITYILSSSKKMSIEDLYIWENLINHDYTPNFKKIEKTDTLKELREIINPIYFSTIKNHERAEIFNDSRRGEYRVSIEKWLNVSKSKIDKINVAQKILFIDKKSILTEEIDNKERVIIDMFLFALFFLLLIIMLIYLSYNLRKSSLYLTETLKEIEAELNERQQLEIQEVIKKNDTIEIYKFLANAIKEPSREKENFLANMSHEIRTPLNGIIGFTNLLKSEELEEEHMEFVNIIEESSLNLLNIVNDILDFAKVSSGKIELESIPFNIMDKFESCIESYAIKATQKNIELGLFIDPELPNRIIGDPTKISQVLLNLLSNAIKFTPNNGKISILIEKVSQSNKDIDIQFSVKDSGIGIEKDKIGKIFDAFSQADASTNRKFGGTGLGLTISSKFVELMNGKLQIISQKDIGSTFFFTIPLKRSIDATTYQTKIEDINIGYLVEDKLIQNDIDKIFQRYIEYLDIDFKTYIDTELFNRKVLPDILFINDRYISNRELLKRFLRLDTKIVFITTTNNQDLIQTYKNKFAKILYKPINFSKTIHTIELLRRTEKFIKIEKEEELESFEKMKILVAEDNIINQKLIFNILKNLKIDVDISSNGEEAVKIYKKGGYDIVLMDIQMPIMSGVEATREIISYEREKKLKHTPIIALTAETSQEAKNSYLQSGMDGYLEKPIKLNRLKSTLQKYFLLKKSNILLYKDTYISSKIYKAILINIGHTVYVVDSEEKFKREILTRKYQFVIFDGKSISNIEIKLVDLIKKNNSTPIIFTEDKRYEKYCKIVTERTNAKELQEVLKIDCLK